MSRRHVSAAPTGATASWVATGTRRLRPPGAASAAELDHWRTAATRRLGDLLGLPDRQRARTLVVDDSPATTPGDEPRLIRMITDEDEIPCWLLSPPADRRLDAAVVAVAGHGPLGIDALVQPSPAAGDYHGGLARKLAAAGFTVLCPELTSFGRRRTPMPPSGTTADSTCQVDAMRGLLTGRPVLGRRVADTLAAVGAVATLDGVDPTKIAIIGGSGGGAVALLSAALDDQVAAAVVGTYVSSFAASLGSVPHCICNAVPDLLTWFEMADLAAMIAPRHLIIEAGRADPIFPLTATESTYAEVLDVWEGIGAHPPDLVITDAGHQFLADDAIALLRGYLQTLS